MSDRFGWYFENESRNPLLSRRFIENSRRFTEIIVAFRLFQKRFSIQTNWPKFQSSTKSQNVSLKSFQYERNIALYSNFFTLYPN